jgi:alpha/beta superfamily hydrolase
MGPEAYYSDFSFGNWIAALASMQKDRIGAMSEDSAIQLKAISELMNDHNAFVLWRTKMVPDRDLNRPMAEILVESFERYPFAVLAEKNAFHAASTALNERI